MELNKKLSELRKSRGLTQQELAEAVNVSRQTVSRWEVGTVVPTLDNLMCLSKLYGVPLDDFTCLKDVTDGTETPEVTPEKAPQVISTVRPRTALLSALLAVLILGVGILIGINIRKEPEVYLHAVPQPDVGGRITVGWLEKTPADVADEAQYLESIGQTLEGYSGFSPVTGPQKTVPNGESEEESLP